MMILYSKIDKLGIINNNYAVYTTEVYRDKLDRNYDYPELKYRNCTYLLGSSVDLVKFIELYKTDPVFVEVLNFICSADDDKDNWSQGDDVYLDDEYFNIMYDYFKYLWEQNRNYAIEAYREFKRCYDQERENYDSTLREAYNKLNDLAHEDREDWPKELGYSPEYYNHLEYIEDLKGQRPRKIKTEFIDGKYYLNGIRCSPEGFIYDPEGRLSLNKQKQEVELEEDSSEEPIFGDPISFDEEIPF